MGQGTASRTKEISEGTTLAWAQLFRPAGHAGQRSFARRNFGGGSRTHPKNTIHTVLHTISYGGSIYLLVVPPLWGSVSQILTLLIGPMDGARGRGAALVAVATEPKNFLVCAGTLWVDTPVSPGGTTPPAPMFRRDGRNFFTARGCNVTRNHV